MSSAPAAPATPAALAQTVTGLINDFTKERDRIENSLNAPSSPTNSAVDIAELKRQELTADLAFREAESTAQASGYKTRRQTLQEFILAFFFTAIIVFTITLMIRSYTATQTWNEALKILGMMTLITAITWGILLRYG
jgi:hypothetical protein